MHTGNLCRYLETRGYGFLALDGGGDEDEATFVHITQLRKAGVDFPQIGSRFEYDIASRKDGRVRAVNLKALDEA